MVQESDMRLAGEIPGSGDAGGGYHPVSPGDRITNSTFAYWFLFLFLVAANPAKPAPNKIKVAGSGTGDGIGVQVHVPTCDWSERLKYEPSAYRMAK